MSVEADEGWAAARLLARQLELFGYRYTEWIVLGRRVFEITG